MSFIINKVTCPNLKEAKEISTHLLEKKLISSANYFPIKSISCWTGKIQEVDEFIILLNTKNENWEKVRDEIKKIHSYKVPCIAKLDSEANEDYESWIKEETK